MLLNSEIIQATTDRYDGGRWKVDVLAKKIGEDRRDRFAVSPRQRQARQTALLAEIGDPAGARLAFERLMGGNDLVGISYLARGTLSARSVCRVHLRGADGGSRGFGTGFLVAPGVLMTNHHVIAGPDDARNALAEFDYEIDLRGGEKPVAAFDILPDALVTSEALDFSLVRVAPRSSDGRRDLGEFGWLILNGSPGKAVVGEYLTIIQHPGGERKQVCVRENKVLRYEDTPPRLWYMTDTVAGSSGSPVFNQSWQVVALHHSGVPEKDRNGRWLTVDGKPSDSSTDESRIKWIANEGIRISAILAHLSERYPEDAVARAVLSPPQPPDAPMESLSSGAGTPGAAIEDGELRVTIPVRVSVRVGEAPRVLPPPSPGATPGAPQPSLGGGILVPPGMESVTVDQSDYSSRPGYSPTFLGAGIRVPFPALSAGLRGKAVLKGQTPLELKYWNYSVVLHRTRKLAIYSAVNVDAAQRPKNAGRDGDRWYYDTRIDERYQLGTDFYPKQAEFEMDRTPNPFDRGHLVRRLDAQWGSTAATAKRNGDDSFHWTNCSPQHWKFNQGAKLWLGLEDYVVKEFAGGHRACVINGPVFDAPLSRTGPDGQPVPDLGGRSRKDPTFGGVAIPKLFFKIVACVDSDGGLAAAAFLMSQEDLLAGETRIRGLSRPTEERLSDAEAALFQVAVADVEALTGLGFGPLPAADTRVNEVTGVAGPRRIGSLEEIRVG